MDRQCGFSGSTESYLKTFYDILDRMIQGMTQAELTDSISQNFIVQMIPHHEAAIEMSRNILRYTSNAAIQDIASRIIDEQTKSIENMKNVECTCAELLNSKQDLCLYRSRTEQIMRTMFSQMRCARSSNRVNCNFMWEMIPHHRGAVEMSANALSFGICPGLIPILRAIMTSQQKGIQEMQRLLQRMAC